MSVCDSLVLEKRTRFARTQMMQKLLGWESDGGNQVSCSDTNAQTRVPTKYRALSRSRQPSAYREVLSCVGAIPSDGNSQVTMAREQTIPQVRF